MTTSAPHAAIMHPAETVRAAVRPPRPAVDQERPAAQAMPAASPPASRAPAKHANIPPPQAGPASRAPRCWANKAYYFSLFQSLPTTMSLSTWLAFLAASWAISFSPGPGAISALASGLKYGFRSGYWTTLGLILGILIQFMIVAWVIGRAHV